MQRPMTVYDLLALRHHFASKKKQTADDKRRVTRLDAALNAIVDSMTTWDCAPRKTED